MNNSATRENSPVDESVLAAARGALVFKFNAVIGTPGDDVAAMQADFIEGKMSHDEKISYVRFCEYMIFYANCRQEEPAE